jgi:hypothetical protein
MFKWMWHLEVDQSRKMELCDLLSTFPELTNPLILFHGSLTPLTSRSTIGHDPEPSQYNQILINYYHFNTFKITVPAFSVLQVTTSYGFPPKFLYLRFLSPSDLYAHHTVISLN